MLPHQTVGMRLEARLLSGFGRGLENVVPVDIVLEDLLPPIPTTHDMVNGSGKLHSHLARHPTPTLQITSIRSRLWFDPFFEKASSSEICGTSGGQCLMPWLTQSAFPWPQMSVVTCDSSACG